MAGHDVQRRLRGRARSRRRRDAGRGDQGRDRRAHPRARALVGAATACTRGTATAAWCTGAVDMEFTHVLVVGAGQMGGGIAQVMAASGRRVSLHDELPGAAEKALETMHRSLEKLAAKGGTSPSAVLERVDVVDQPGSGRPHDRGGRRERRREDRPSSGRPTRSSRPRPSSRPTPRPSPSRRSRRSPAGRTR